MKKCCAKKWALSSNIVERHKGEYKVPFKIDFSKKKLVERQKGEYKYELLKAPDFCENPCNTKVTSVLKIMALIS